MNTVQILLFDRSTLQALKSLREVAVENAVHMPTLMQRLDTFDGKHRHMAQLIVQSIDVPVGYTVTFSIELEHPCGNCRHMSMSTPSEDHAPHEYALWMVAKELGFWGAITDCVSWFEPLDGRPGIAVNLVQPINQA